MATRHFLYERLNALLLRHKKSAEDALPKEATMSHYMDSAAKVSRKAVLQSVGVNVVILASGYVAHYGLGFDLKASLGASIGLIVASSLLMDKFHRQKKVREFAEKSIEDRDRAVENLFTVRRYNWSSGLILDSARKIGLFMDYCMMYALLVEKKPYLENKFEFVTGTANYYEIMSKIDDMPDFNRVDAINALLNDMKNRIEDVHRLANLDDRRMAPAIWSIREAQPFWDIFEKMVASIAGKIISLSRFSGQDHTDNGNTVVEMPGLNALAKKEVLEIEKEVRALADIVEPLFSQSGPIAVEDKLTEEKFKAAKSAIEELAE